MNDIINQDDITGRTELAQNAHMLGLANQAAQARVWKFGSIVVGVMLSLLGAGVAVPAYVTKIAHTDEQDAIRLEMAQLKIVVGEMKAAVAAQNDANKTLSAQVFNIALKIGAPIAQPAPQLQQPVIKAVR